MKIEQDIDKSIKCHQNILKVLEFFKVENSSLFIQIMELCEQDLFKEIEKRKNDKKPFSFDEIINLFYQMINALVEIESNNIVHQDIKPQNILKEKQGVYKLTDFGVSNSYGPNGESESRGFTRRYCSPEQLVKDYILNKSDIYSMGLTFLNVLNLELTDEMTDNIRKGNLKDLKFDDYQQYKTLITFIKSYMLQQQEECRLDAILLKSKFIYYFFSQSKIIDLDQDFKRISQLILSSIQNIQDRQQNKYLAQQIISIQQLYSDHYSIYSENYANQNSYSTFNVINLIDQQKFEYYNKVRQYLNAKVHTDYDQSLNLLPVPLKVIQGDEISIEFNLKILQMIVYHFQSGIELSQREHKKQEQIFKSIAKLYLNIIERKQSSKYALIVLKMIKALYNRNHPDVHHQINQISLLHERLENDQLSLKFKNEPLGINQALLKINPPSFLKSINPQKNDFQNEGNDQKFLQNNPIKIDRQLSHTNHTDITNQLTQFIESKENLGYDQQMLDLKFTVLAIRKFHYKSNHPELAESLNSVAISLAKFGKIQDAKYYCFKALQMRKEMYTKKHPDIAQSLHTLAIYYERLGDDKKSLQLNRKALKMRIDLFSDYHPYIAQSLILVGISHSRIGEEKKALKYYIKALKLRKQLYSKNDPNIAESYHFIGISCSKLRQLKRAQKCFSVSLNIRKSIYPDNHPTIAQSYNAISNFYAKIGQNEQSLYLSLKTLEMRKQLQKKDHPDIAQSLNAVAQSYMALQQYQEAINFYIQAITMNQIFYKGSHLNIASILIEISINYEKLEEDKKSLEFSLKALEMRKEIYPHNHPNIFNSQNSVGKCFSRLKNFEKSLEHKLLAFEMIKDLSSSLEKLDICELMNSIAYSYLQLKDYENALNYFYKALKELKDLFSDSHPDIQKQLQIISFISIYEQKERIIQNKKPDF